MNRLYRAFLLWQAQKRPGVRELIRARCKDDIHFFISTWVWQFNPNAIGEGSEEIGPFITWDFQEEAIEEILWCVENREDLLIEKSREMGASWLCLLVMLWFFLFHPWKKFLCVSRSEEAVDKPGDSDSLFWKLDFVLERIPKWLKGDVQRRKLSFVHKDTKSSITGQASTGRAGVGGRCTAMFVDEFSRIKEDYDLHQSTASTTDCRIFNGTHWGTNTCFFDLARGKASVIRKLTMHWTQHPDKPRGAYRYDVKRNAIDVLDKQYAFPPDYPFLRAELPAGGLHPGIRSPWYDKKCRQLKNDPTRIAQELDIDPSGSVSQFFDPLTIRHLIAEWCRAPVWEGTIHFNTDTGKPLSLEKLAGGPLRLWVRPREDGTLPEGAYGCGADVSTGLGATNSCLSGFNAETGEKVLEYANATIKPEDFGPLCLAMCWLLKDAYGEPALFCWEHAGPGLLLAKRVLEIGYPRLAKRGSLKRGQYKSVHEQWGWYPSNDAKRVLLDEYRASLGGRQCLNLSEVALKDCLPYRFDPGTGTVSHPEDVKSNHPSGARINHGDLVISDALAWKMCQQLGIVKATAKIEAAPPTILCMLGRRQWHEQKRKMLEER